jgi:hemolysin activation/secretion protein
MGKGYATTRVVAPPQDLKSGILKIKIIPGVVSDVVLSGESGKYIRLYPVVPVRKTKLLNARDLEQGLENLRRIPTVQTDFKLVPGENEGESKIEVLRKQGRPVRVMLSADDSGSRYTGKNQGTATLFLDNMLGLSDMFYASIGTNLEHRHKPHGTDNYSFHYSIPWTFWQLNFFHNNYEYDQKVVGYATDYTYSGESRNTTLELSRVLLRTSKSKTSASIGGYLNTSGNYIDDTELEIQRRRQAGWEIGVNHRQFIGPAIFDADFRFRRGTGAFNAIRAPEEAMEEGTARPKILTMNLRLNIRFKIKSQNFRFSTVWRQQWAFNKLLQRDRLSVGNRYTVRGYDGEFTLSGDNGFASRTELAYAIPKINQEIYSAFDVGRVWGPGSEWLLGQMLSGVALGWRGSIRNFSYDGFVSRPVNKPYKYPGDRWVWGFSAALQF